jgi:hypothetical protein
LQIGIPDEEQLALSELDGTFAKSSSELRRTTSLGTRFDREVAKVFLKI